MNKTALMNYALSARKELESQIALSLNKLGIYEDSIKRADIVGDYTIIEGTEETFPKRVYELRNTIISDHIQPDGFKNVVEEFAYTWFNRIIALRFMEVHDYFDHGFRVLTSRDGSYEPEILKNVMYVIDDLKLNKAVVESLSTQGKTEELYRYILFSQCNKLSGILPMLFSTQEAYMELLLPNNLLSAESVIRKIQEIPEEDFKNDVEVIGWLYQFYNSVKKDEVFASKETITKDTLPAVTQLFTPDWIVRYMAQNSVGRIWLESHPDSPLKEKMKYYVDDAEQTPEVQAKLDAIKYKNVNLETLEIIEPCCGSGHILVYVFDLLFEMYKENGYAIKDIPATILKNNLYGLDVDKRAAQLSQFALMMKARSIDNRFFSETRIVIPHIYEIQDSKLLISLNYQEMIKEFGFTSSAASTIQYLVDTFRDGKVIGSLLKVEKKDYQQVVNETDAIRNEYTPNLFQNSFFYSGLNRVIELCVLGSVLSKKYDVLITNPPYCGTGNIEKDSKAYFFKNYQNSKFDFFTMFMETDLVKESGFVSMINMQSWMFLSGYKKLRYSLIKDSTFLSLLQLGSHGFDSIGGEVVQTCSFVFTKKEIDDYVSIFLDLKEGKGEKEKAADFFTEKRYKICQKTFLKVEGFPFAYWLSQAVVNDFVTLPNLDSFLDVKNGMSTTDNGRFLRFWYEVDPSTINFSAKDRKDANLSGKKWFPYNKGGEYKKWFGNEGLVVNWKNDGEEIRKSAEGASGGRIVSEDFYFHQSVSWSKVSPGRISFRFYPEGHLFDVAGPSIFGDFDKQLFAIALLNSSIKKCFIESIAPTVNYERGQVSSMPVFFKANEAGRIEDLAKENIEEARHQWSESELSWEFVEHPILRFRCDTVEESFNRYVENEKARIQHVKTNEELINDYFAKLYGVQDEINVSSSFDETGLRLPSKREVCSSLISYFVGCLFGRFRNEAISSLCISGLGEALPIYSFIGIDGGLEGKICECIRLVFGEKNYKQNIGFFADGLGKEGRESSEESINRYLNNSFFEDHVRLYQKRPIYWMLSSGKSGAFKCLIYIHKYSENTLAKINSKLFLPYSAVVKNEKSRLFEMTNENGEDSAEAKRKASELSKAVKQEDEISQYGQVLDHMANQFINLDLDDGVKANYDKFQGITVEMNGQTIKKDLLVPIK
jgi:hypothetical protein